MSLMAYDVREHKHHSAFDFMDPSRYLEREQTVSMDGKFENKRLRGSGK